MNKNKNKNIKHLRKNRYLSLHPNAPKVFFGLVKYTGHAFLPLLDDTVALMLSSIDHFSSPLPVFILMRILHSIVGVLYGIAVEERKTREKEKEEKREKVQDPEDTKKMVDESVEELRKYFEDFKKKKDQPEPPKRAKPTEDDAEWKSVKIEEILEGDEEKENEEVDQEEEEAEEDKIDKKKLDDNFKTKITRRQREFVRQILEKSRHFVGYSIREMKLLILDIINLSFIMLVLLSLILNTNVRTGTYSAECKWGDVSG